MPKPWFTMRTENIIINHHDFTIRAAIYLLTDLHAILWFYGVYVFWQDPIYI